MKSDENNYKKSMNSDKPEQKQLKNKLFNNVYVEEEWDIRLILDQTWSKKLKKAILQFYNIDANFIFSLYIMIKYI